MSVSQQKIADALNLSVITVSRALRDHPDMAKATKARVLQKARELGYSKFQRRPVSADPAPRRAGILLYDSPHGDKQDSLASGVKRRIFLALQKECQRLQIETLIETPSLEETPLIVKNRTIQAAFVFGRYTTEAIAHLKDIPSIAVSSFIDCPDLPRIVADNLNGMRLTTEHLISLGHSEILFLGIRDSLTRLFAERADGYVAAMHRSDLTPSVRFCQTHNDLPDPAELRRWTAIVCASDGLAYNLHAKLSAAGLKIPRDISIAGFDNLPSDYPYPITTYSPDWDMMGAMAAGLLLSSPLDIRNKGLVVTVPGKLKIAGSTAALPGNAPSAP